MLQFKHDFISLKPGALIAISSSEMLSIALSDITHTTKESRQSLKTRELRCVIQPLLSYPDSVSFCTCRVARSNIASQAARYFTWYLVSRTIACVNLCKVSYQRNHSVGGQFLQHWDHRRASDVRAGRIHQIWIIMLGRMKKYLNGVCRNKFSTCHSSFRIVSSET